MLTRFYIANNRPFTHILFWVGYLLIYTGVHADGGDGWWIYFTGELQGVPAAMLIAYVNMYVLFPRFFLARQYISYGLLAILLLFVVSILNRIFGQLVAPVLYPQITERDPVFVWYMILKSMLWFLSPILLLTLVIKVFQQSVQQEQRYQETVRERLTAELNFLKAQVHPHFLFNTLNNLYALTLQSSQSAPKVVLKLSELMSYMLYDAQSASIALGKEIAHIQNYVELEKLRYNNRLEVSLNVSGEIGQKRIAPLLLIPFVENAFKHGVANDIDQVWVTIDIKAQAAWVSVQVENSYTPGIAASAGEKSGIGLQNVTRRLELLYPQMHELTIQKEQDRYMVDLKIKLS